MKAVTTRGTLLNRIVSVLVATVLVVGLNPATAIAEGPDPSLNIDHDLMCNSTPIPEGIATQNENGQDVVYISISSDGQYLVSDGEESGIPMANIAIPIEDVATVSLDEYGYSRYNFDDDSDGEYEITVLHLYLYVLERYYSGGAASMVAADQAPGSFFITSFWGHNQNFTYYTNIEYPLQYEGWGATCDRIILRPGLAISVSMHSDSAYYGSSLYGHQYFYDTTKNPVRDAALVEYSAIAGEPITMGVMRAGASMATENYDTSYYADEDQIVYYGKNYVFGGGTELGVTDEKGQFIATFPESGVYYVWVDGLMDESPNANAGLVSVSSPACARVVVDLPEAAPTFELDDDVLAESGEDVSVLVHAVEGEPYNVSIKIAGYPYPNVVVEGLPSGLEWDYSYDVAGSTLVTTTTISGVPTAEPGQYQVFIIVDNGIAPDDDDMSGQMVAQDDGTSTAVVLELTLVVEPPKSVATASVDFTSQLSGAFLHAPQFGASVPANKAESYGYTDSVDGVSALDVLVAAHELVYGEDFTAETAETYLVINEATGSPTMQFAVPYDGEAELYEDPSYVGMFFVNHAFPNDGTTIGDSGMYKGTTVGTHEVHDGDLVEFFFNEDAFLGDTYNWFVDADDTYSRTFTTCVDEDLTLTLRGITVPEPAYYCKDETATVAFGNLQDPDYAQLCLVDLETGALAPIEGAVVEDYGDVTLNFDELGTYTITAYGIEDETMFSQIMSLTTINVVEHQWETEFDAPTFTENGLLTTTCSVCDSTQSVDIPAYSFEVKVGDTAVPASDIAITPDGYDASYEDYVTHEKVEDVIPLATVKVPCSAEAVTVTLGDSFDTYCTYYYGAEPDETGYTQFVANTEWGDYDAARYMYVAQADAPYEAAVAEGQVVRVQTEYDANWVSHNLYAIAFEPQHNWGTTPAWTWTGNDEAGYTAAIATFTCENDSEHTQPLNAELSSVKQGTSRTYTATVEFGGQTYTDTKTVAIPVTTAAVDFTSQLSGGFLHAPQFEYEVSSNLAEAYGYDDAVDGVSALDVLVAAHELTFEEDFTPETATEFLAVTNNNVDMQFGVEQVQGSYVASYKGMFFVNRAFPTTGETYQEKPNWTEYLGTTVGTHEVHDGDLVEFFFNESDYMGDTYNWFVDEDGEYGRTFTVAAGEDLDLTLMGFYAANADRCLGEMALVNYSGASAQEDVQIYVVDLETGAVAEIEDAITDEDGMVTLSFDAPGTYTITAYGADDLGMAVQIMSLTTITVTAAPNTAPHLAEGVSATAAAEVALGNAWMVDLSTIFGDNEDDALTYTVKVGDADAVTADAKYSYTPTAAGTYTLVFQATDAVGATSADTYTVTLTANEPEVTTASINLLAQVEKNTLARVLPGFTVSSDEAAKYGYEKPEAFKSVVTMVDAAAALHHELYGEDFDENPEEYLKIAAAGTCSLIFGEPTYTNGFKVNDETPEYPDQPGMGSLWNDTPLSNGDDVRIFLTHGEYYGLMESYLMFDEDAYATHEGGSVEVEVTGDLTFGTMMSMPASVAPAEDAVVYAVADYTNPAGTKVAEAVTDEDGVASFANLPAGAYHLVVVEYENDSGDDCFSTPYATLTVSPHEWTETTTLPTFTEAGSVLKACTVDDCDATQTVRSIPAYSFEVKVGDTVVPSTDIAITPNGYDASYEDYVTHEKVEDVIPLATVKVPCSAEAVTVTLGDSFDTYCTYYYGAEPDETGYTQFIANTEWGDYDAARSMYVAQADAPYEAAVAEGQVVRVQTEYDANWVSHNLYAIAFTPVHGELDSVAKLDPKCEEAGHEAYWQCPNCETLFADAAGATAIDAPKTIPATDHAWDAGKVTTEPTVGAVGVKTFTCANDSTHTRTEPIPKVDPSALEDAIAAAQQLAEGIVVSDDGNDVPNGAKYVTTAASEALAGVVAVAEKAASDPASTQSDVDAGLSALLIATSAFEAAVKTAKVDTSQLESAVAAAKDVVKNVTVSDDGTDVDPSDKWASQEDVDDFAAAVAAAQAKIADENPTQTQIDEAAAMLAGATEQFEKAIKSGTKSDEPGPGPEPVVVDKKALDAAISAAQEAAKQASVSADGTDVSPDDTWVTQDAADALANAIAAAKKVSSDPKATQAQVNEAAKAVADAQAAFDAAKKPGTKKDEPKPDPDPVDKAWTRLAGNNAFETMQAIIDAGKFEAGGTVVLASLEGYWDALTAAGVAGLEQAPVIMTLPDGLSDEAVKELESLAPKKIVVCGGTYWIPDSVFDAAAAAAGTNPEKVRLAGAVAVNTAEEIAAYGKGKWSETAIIATVGTFQDALAAAPVSYAKAMPIYLAQFDFATETGSLAQTTIDSMKANGITKAYIAGGTYWLPKGVSDQLKAAGITVEGQLMGETAVETSAAIAAEAVALGMSADGCGLANSLQHYDALASAAFCGKAGSVLLLVNDTNRSSIDSFVEKNARAIGHGYVFGGTGSVSPDTMAAAEEAAAK